MPWFDFGFSGFGQIVPRARGSVGVKVLFPDCDVGQTRVSRAENDEQLTGEHSGTEIRATWSRLVVLHRQTGDGHVSISGFVASPPNQNPAPVFRPPRAAKML